MQRQARRNRRPSRYQAQQRADMVIAAILGVCGLVILTLCAVVWYTPGAINPDYQQVAGDIIGLGVVVGAGAVAFAGLIFNHDYR